MSRSLDEVPTPALLLDLDVLERNLTRMQARADRLGVTTRPHVKTHKCVEIAKKQRALGARGITVSTIAEARAFAEAGFDDITWALPNPLSHAQAILELGRKITLGILFDDLQAAARFDQLAEQSGLKNLHAWIKIDCGYHRAGVDPGSPDALALLERVTKSRALIYDGILTHAGHSYHASSRDELRRIAREEREVMLEFKARAEKSGLDVRKISIGSTPTLSVAEDLTGVDEIRPGNYVFFDRTQATIGSCAIEDCAVTVLASVISHQPRARHFVTDAGALALSKDLGPDQPAPCMGLLFRDYATRAIEPAIGLEALSQEHGIVGAPAVEAIDARFAVGSRVRILENHSCLTAAQFDEYVVVRGDEVVDRWRIRRER